MNKIHALLGMVLAGLAIWLVATSNQPVTRNPSLTSAPPTPLEPERIKYTSEKHGISFTYSPDFFLVEKDAGTPQTPQHSITLAEDTQENRDLFAGKVQEPREGPPTITIEIHANQDQQTAADWVQNNTNWTLRTSRMMPTTISSASGVYFQWTGLYEGESHVVTHQDKVYSISTTWLDEASATIPEFQAVQESIRFLQ